MDSFFVRFKNPLVLIAIVLMQVIALAMQLPARAAGFDAHDGHNVTLLRRWTVALVMPVANATHSAGLHIRDAWQDYIDLRNTRADNVKLKLDVARLREEQAAFAEDAAQGRRLQQLLAFQQQYIASTVAAQVIGTSGSDRSRMLYLDKGSVDGLKPEQAVITPDGVVGKLRDVFPHTAQVLLINDVTSGAGVILEGSRIRGILRGTADGQVQINNLTADSRIKPGETVVTSGGDMVYPRGLPVGQVESIKPDPQHQPYTAITVKPAANLSRLEEVLVITGTQSTLPDAAQQDATAAAAAAEANQRAADVIAERLPSLHSDAAAEKTDGSDSAAAVDNAPPPRPTPTVHMDRYSPGATPPAAALQPGVPVTPVVPETPKAVPPATPTSPTSPTTEPQE
jgi:rod shape-determining protein MreC